MSNSRKLAFKRFNQLKSHQLGESILPSKKIENNPPKRRIRQDEMYVESVERMFQDIEDRMIDLSRWSGEGSLYKYLEFADY